MLDVKFHNSWSHGLRSYCDVEESVDTYRESYNTIETKYGIWKFLKRQNLSYKIRILIDCFRQKVEMDNDMYLR
jgi:hypothetical protein